MAIILRDKHLEERIENIRHLRRDGSKAKTLGDLAREYLTQLGAITDAHPAPTGEKVDTRGGGRVSPAA